MGSLSQIFCCISRRHFAERSNIHKHLVPIPCVGVQMQLAKDYELPLERCTQFLCILGSQLRNALLISKKKIVSHGDIYPSKKFVNQPN